MSAIIALVLIMGFNSVSNNIESSMNPLVPPSPFFTVYDNACCPYGQLSEGSITITQQHINNLIDGYFHIYSMSWGTHQIYEGTVYKNGVVLESDAWPCPYIGNGIVIHTTLNVGDVIKFQVVSDCLLDEGCICTTNGQGSLNLSYYRY
jgi:hypothetical protein